MHHSAGRLPDQHHGLWGVCPPYSSTSLLPPRVHLQLWNRRSKVPLYTLTCLVAGITCVECKCRTWQPVWYSGAASHTMAPWGAPFPCTPLTAPLLMRLWWDKEPQARLVCVPPCKPMCVYLLWHSFPPPPRQPCLIPTAPSFPAREERRRPSAEKVSDTTVNLQEDSQIRNLLLHFY